MKNKQYEEAIETLKKILNTDGTNEEYYYNLALAKFRGSRPFRLTKNQISSIIQDIDTAIRINNNKEKIHLLKAIVHDDYFGRRGLAKPTDSIHFSFEELINTRVELKRMSELIDIQYEDIIKRYIKKKT